MPLRFLRPVTALALFAVVFGASVGISQARTQATHATRPAHAMTNVYFILNWLPNVEFDGLWVAQQKGWFKAAGINLGFKGWAPGVFPETDVPARGGNTFGFQSGAAIAIAASKGVPIRAVYSDTQRSVFGLTVLAKSNIQTLKDLKGKKIGFQSHELYVPETMMSCVGLQEGRDWKPVQVGFDTSQLTSGQVDAYLTFLTNEPIALKMAGVPVRSFAAADHCFHFYDDVMFTTNGLIHSNPTLVRKVTALVARGFAWAHTHPDIAARLTVRSYFPASAGTSAAQNLRQQVLESRAFEKFSKDAHGKYSGLMTQSYWQDSINILARYHQISKKPSAALIFTNDFNPNK